jgi:hypothetical protein
MADDFLINIPGSSVTVRAVQLAGGQYAQVLFVAPMRWTPVAPPEKLSITTGSVVTLSPPGTATHAIFANDKNGNDLRWYDDGSTPTTGVTGNGPVLSAGDYLEIDLAAFTTFKAIAVSATTTAHIIYRKIA